MSNIIKIKRGSTGGVVPSGLTFGELAVNITDRKMFVGGATGNTIELLGGGTVAFSGVTGINGLTGNVSITAGTNITLVQSGNLITLSAAGAAAPEAAASAPPLASSSITGSASFNINHFVIGTTGHVSLASGYQITGDTVVANDGILATRSNNTVTLSNIGVTGVNGLTGNVSITAGTNITLVQSGNLITLSAVVSPPLASSSITGAASFNINHFSVSTTGHVSLLNTGVTGINGLTGNVSITAGTNITLVQSGNLITLSAAASVPPPLASSSITGAASFNINDFVVSTTGHVGLTGTIARTNTTQIFSGLQTFNSGASASYLLVGIEGATFTSNASFNGGLSSTNLFVGGGGATFASNVSFNSTTNHLGLAAFAGGITSANLSVGGGGATFASNASFNSTTNHTGLAAFAGGITSSSLWVGGGGATFSSNVVFAGTVTVPTPTNNTDATNKVYVDSLASGINWHQAVTALSDVQSASTYVAGTAGYDGGTGVGAYIEADANGALTAIDSVSVVVGNRILMTGRTNTIENGIYTITSVGSAGTKWRITRATDMDGHNAASTIIAGDAVYVTSGTDHGELAWIETGTGTGTGGIHIIGTDPIVWTSFTGTATFVAGAGLTANGKIVDVNVDNSTVEISSDILRIKDGGVSNTKLANSSITVNVGSGLTGGGVVSLGGTVTLSNTGVTGVNGLTGNISITAGTNITLVQSGNLITLSAAASVPPPLASSSITGSASFNINDFVVSTTGHVGLTGTIARTNTAQTFTGLQTFNAGITSVNLFVGGGGATFASDASFSSTTNHLGLATFVGGASASYLLVGLGGATFASNASFNSTTNHTGLATFTGGITSSSLWIGGGGATFASNASFSSTTNHLGLATFAGGLTSNSLFIGGGGATFASNASFSSTTNHSGLATFSGGITSSSLWIGGGGATFASNASFSSLGLFNAGITSSSLWVGGGGATFASNASFSSTTNHLGLATFSGGITSANLFIGGGGATFASNASFSSLGLFNAGITSTNLFVGGGGATFTSNASFSSTTNYSGLATFASGASASYLLVGLGGATFSGNLYAPNIVNSVNGITASVSITAGTNITLVQSGNLITLSAAAASAPPLASYSLTGAASFSTNDFVIGTTGHVGLTGTIARTNTAQTFTGLQTFNAGITSTNLFVGGGGATFASNASFSSTTNHTGLATFAGGITSSSLWIGGGATFSGNISASGNVVFNAVTAVFGASAANTTPITLYKDNSTDNPAAGDEFTGISFDTPNNKVPLTLSFTEVYNPDSGLTDTTPGSTMIRVRNQNQNTDNFTVTDLGDIVCGNIICGGITPTSFGGSLSIGGGNSITLNWSGVLGFGEEPPTVFSVYKTLTSANTLTLNGDGSFSQLSTSGALQYGAASVLNDSYTLTTGATGATTMASWTKTQYRSFEFDIQGARGTTGPYQFTKILAVHDGTTVTSTQLSNISTGVTAGTYTVDISGTIVRLRVTPFSATSTVFKTTVKAIPV
jgi:collagen type VII alpha